MNSCHHGNTVVVFNNACPLCAMQLNLTDALETITELREELEEKEDQIGVLVQQVEELEAQLEELEVDDDDVV